MPKETLEVLARMTDSKVKVREVVDKWLLLTYDLPKSEEGNAARQQFLLAAAAIGAKQHTESVYLMPWSPEAERVALALARIKGGEVIVWTQAEPLNHKEDITKGYDAALKPLLKEISERLDRMGEYRRRHFKRFVRMLPKTDRLLANAEAAISRRGSEILLMWLELLKQRYTQVTEA